MKIYIIPESYEQGIEILGAYSTKEKAIEALPYFNSDERDIYEVKLDAPNVGEKYEKFYCYKLGKCFKADNRHFFEIKMLPCQFVPFHFVNHIPNAVVGYGKTKEEAKENAKNAIRELHPIWQIAYDGFEIHHGHPSMIRDWAETPYGLHEDYNVAKIAITEYLATGKIGVGLVLPKK